MSPIKRREFILNYLKRNNSIRTKELSQELSVTRETIRKDLYDLEKEGLLNVVHGGAILKDGQGDTMYAKRNTLYQQEKKDIANLAIDFISEGDTVYLGYGTTTYAIAEALYHFKNITVITNSLPIVNLLIRNNEIDLVFLGGVVRRSENSVYGDITIRNLEDIFVNVSFVGCTGIDEEVGITDAHFGESSIARAIIKHSKCSLVCCDSSKFNHIGVVKIALLTEVTCILTDDHLNDKFREDFINKGAKVLRPKDVHVE